MEPDPTEFLQIQSRSGRAKDPVVLAGGMQAAPVLFLEPLPTLMTMTVFDKTRFVPEHPIVQGNECLGRRLCPEVIRPSTDHWIKSENNRYHSHMAAFPPDVTKLLLSPSNGFCTRFDTPNPSASCAAIFVMSDMKTQELEAILKMDNSSFLLRELEASLGQPFFENPYAHNGILLGSTEH